MKKDLKSKANSRAKSPTAKRAPKTPSKDALVSTKAAMKSKVEVAASKSAGAKAKAAAVKAKTPSVKAKAAKAKPVGKSEAKSLAKPAAERAAKVEKPKTVNTKARKPKDAAAIRIGEPVLDPIGDVISGEARTYLGEAESQGHVEAPGQAEMDAYRADTDTEAEDGTPEGGPGAAAASGAGADEAEGEEESVAKERPPAKLERLQKILSQAGIASRRHAEEMIVAGRVIVNGQVVTQLGSKADAARDHIRVDGKLLQGAERHRYFVLNKPKGYVTTVSDPEKRPTVMDFFAKTNERLYPVGRLDYLSEGLLLMTNDGELANLLTKAKSGVEKVYLVKVAGQPTEEELDRLRGGIAIERGEAGSERVRTSPARIRLVRVGDNPWYEVVLTEGRNRELRKMFAAIGHFAEKIRRVGYGPLVLDVEPGKLRELTMDEVKALRLTAEGKIKPRRLKVDISHPKDAGRAPGQRGDRGARPWRDKPAGKRFDGPRGGAPSRGAKPFGQREERGPRTEWKPRERTFGGGSATGAERSGERGGERPRFDKRSSGPPRAGSGFGARPSRPFGAKPGFGARLEGDAGRREGGAGQGRDRGADRGSERPRFDKRSSGPPRTGSGFGARPSRPFGAKPAFGARREGDGGRREGGAGRSGERSGERKEWKPRGPDFGAKPGERPTGRFENAPRKPFRAQGAFVRPAFARPEGSFKRSDGPKKPFAGGRGAGPGAGKSSDRRTGSKARWVPRPGGARTEEGRAQTGGGVRPAPAFGGERSKGSGSGEGAGRTDAKRTGSAFGARPGGFKRPGKPGGFSRPGGSRPGGFSKPGRPGGANRGGSRFGGKRPDGR
jgi:23S rRNA pseudouridine2605 synthase